jgi:hemolysin III
MEIDTHSGSIDSTPLDVDMMERNTADNFHNADGKLERELANAITHGIGVVIFMVAIPYLIICSMMHGSYTYSICTCIYGFGVLMAYITSTLYHGIQHTKAKYILRVCDHISIFILIGGSYTPVVLRYLPRTDAIPFLTALWTILLIGAIYKVFFTGKYKLFSTIMYTVLGCLVFLIVRPLLATMSTQVFVLMLGGGVGYIFGLPFYLNKNFKYNHAVWHLFVLAGSISHYFMILYSIV